jgi:colanic acid biosynthesis glycosyl transferase WcaI
MNPRSSDSPSTRPRVLFLNRSYWPCAEATGQLLTELCEDLAHSFDVTVVAGQPNQNPERRSFHVRGVDRRRGVQIRRVWNSTFSKAWLPGKAVNLLSYLLTASLAAVRLPRPEVIVVETDPPLLCVLGAFLRHWYGAKLVVYLQDIYPDVAVALGKLPNSIPTRWLRKLMFGIYRRADRVVVLSQEMRSLLVESGISGERISCIPNWVDTRQIRPVKQDNPFRARLGLEDEFLVMYSGNIGLSQRLEDLLAAAAALRDRSDIRFLLVGDGASKPALEETVRQYSLTNVSFLPYQPKDELAASLSAADLQVVSIDPRVTKYLMPSKLYGVLASGTAVLAVAPQRCELAEVTRSQQVGLVVPPADPAVMAETILWCADHRDELRTMGQRGCELAREEYDRAILTERFAEMLSELVGQPVPQAVRAPVADLSPVAPSTVVS